MGNAHAGRALPARIQGWVAAAGSACQGSPTGAGLHWLNLNIPGHRHTQQALTLQYLERFESMVTHSIIKVTRSIANCMLSVLLTDHKRR